ncbi:hypothetical protein [Nocardioides sp. SYSU DS0663]|uniref:hypothetical protein n=1 Tax=Nocardioides sp. SYSU DS0663 TaxID=3416445 RepID=UPI003F4C1093
MTGSLVPRLLSRPLAALLGVSILLSSCGTGEGERGVAEEPPLRSTDLLISADDLPPGWSDSNSQGLDYRVEVCGVDLEPEDPVRATSIRFSRGPLGPFLEQHVRVYRSDVASGVVANLRAALTDCTEYAATGSRPDSPEARFAVEPLTVDGAPAESVAWRQTSQGDLPVTADVLLVPRGDAAVLLMSYALRATPDPEVLANAVAALPEAP